MSLRVLVIDDDELVLRVTATSLSRAGFDVTTADDAGPAFALTKTFDAIVVDFNMKTDLTGADVVRHFKQLHGDGVRCLVLSGEDDDEIRTRCFEAGAADVLIKPISPAVLRQHLTGKVAA